ARVADRGDHRHPREAGRAHRAPPALRDPGDGANRRRGHGPRHRSPRRRRADRRRPRRMNPHPFPTGEPAMQNGSGRGRVIVLDPPLGDGEQAPGASMSLQQNLQVSRVLGHLGVDVIEAGFPVASPGDFEAVQAVARTVDGPTIAALARASRGDIDRAVDALAGARRQRVHVFLATSPIHRQHKLKMSREDVLKLATGSVQYARSRCEDVEFSAEDAARTEPEFLAEVVERVIEAGATTINIPDTVGYAVPAQFAELITFLRRTVRGIDDVVLSVHCHDDLGLAVANSLAALQAGARQVECTVNGIGERAGNCSLEEVVMALRTRADYLKLETGIRTQQLCNAT